MHTRQPVFRNHLFSLKETELALHKNLMTCVIFGRENPVLVGNETSSLEAKIICIQPGVAHRVEVRRGGAEILYLDGVQLAQNRAAFKELAPKWHHIPSRMRAVSREPISALRDALEAKRPAADLSVMEIVEHLYTDPFERMSQTELAQRLRLERTMALRHFKAETGQTFRKFKIWAGIVAAAHSAHKGEKIGLAGVDAGFSDAAHTARIAKEVFGMTPTKGLGGLLKMQTLQ